MTVFSPARLRLLLKSLILMTALHAGCAGQERAPLELPSAQLSAAERQACYSAMVSEFAGEAADDQVWVLALRGLGVRGQRHDSRLSAGGYNDTLVLLRPGHAEVLEFAAATHPGVERSAHSPWGVAQVRPGRYRATSVR